MIRLNLALALSVAGVGLLVPAYANAHFLLNAPQSWWSQASDGSPQKTPPCGDEATTGTAATHVVSSFQPGQTVSVTVQATIAHPGWYRISLKEGASASQTTSTLPDPPTLGAAGSAQQCTPAFIDNPVWSPTQPVLADKLGLPAGSTSTTTVQNGTQTFQVTIPASANCTQASPCTLQVLMFMTDHPAGSCNYHHCADIAVGAGGATSSGGAGGASASGGSTAAGASTKGGATSVGGASTAGGATSAGGANASGASTAGGATSAGGSSAGGTTSATSGGTTSAGGATNAGTTSAGGALGSGGTTGVAGASTGSAAAGATSGGSKKSGSCSLSAAPHGGDGVWLFAGALGMFGALRRRRR